MSTSTDTDTTFSDIIKILIDSNKSLSIGELEIILEHQKVFDKYIDIMITDVRIKFANLKMKGQEAKGYLTIEILENIKKDMEKSRSEFKKMRIDQEKEKEIKKVL